jgi:hypothetical protein
MKLFCATVDLGSKMETKVARVTGITRSRATVERLARKIRGVEPGYC